MVRLCGCEETDSRRVWHIGGVGRVGAKRRGGLSLYLGSECGCFACRGRDYRAAYGLRRSGAECGRSDNFKPLLGRSGGDRLIYKEGRAGEAAIAAASRAGALGAGSAAVGR